MKDIAVCNLHDDTTTGDAALKIRKLPYTRARGRACIKTTPKRNLTDQKL